MDRSAAATRSFDVFFDLRLDKRLSKQSWGWWFGTQSRPLCRHCNVVVYSWNSVQVNCTHTFNVPLLASSKNIDEKITPIRFASSFFANQKGEPNSWIKSSGYAIRLTTTEMQILATLLVTIKSLWNRTFVIFTSSGGILMLVFYCSGATWVELVKFVFSCVMNTYHRWYIYIDFIGGTSKYVWTYSIYTNI